MKRAAWINQALAAWLIGFIVFGLGDSASAGEILSHGVAALILLLASWRLLTDPVAAGWLSAVQIVAGAWLCLMPVMFGYPVHSFVTLNDVAVGATVLVDGVIELWSSGHRGHAHPF
jgi:hypothetical protein